MAPQTQSTLPSIPGHGRVARAGSKRSADHHVHEDDENEEDPAWLRRTGSKASKESSLSGLSESDADENPSPDSERHLAISEARAATILRKFKFYQEMNPRMQQLLPTICNRSVYPAGTVLFRQGDPPGNCYVILSGRVEICTLSEDELRKVEEYSPRDLTSIFKRSSTMRRSMMVAWFNSGQVKSAESREAALGAQPRKTMFEVPDVRKAKRQTIFQPNVLTVDSGGADGSANAESTEGECHPPATRSRTVEGFSFYHDYSTLGDVVATLEPGSILGELALLNNSWRMATARCREEIEVLVITHKDFDKVLKEDIHKAKEEMISFLEKHVPGMREVPPIKGKPHASYYFQKLVFTKGHVFLRQGKVFPASEEHMYVIHSGGVEYRRYDRDHTRAAIPGESGGSLPSTPAHGSRRPRGTGLAESGSQRVGTADSWSPGTSRLGHSSSTPQLSRPGSSSGAGGEEPGSPVVQAGAAHRMVGYLTSGAVFGSLPAHGTPEPFTVVAATSTVEVYIINADGLSKLHKRLADTMRDYVTRATMWHLDRLRLTRGVVSEQEFKIANATVAMQQAGRHWKTELSGAPLMRSTPIDPLLKGMAVREGAGARGGVIRGNRKAIGAFSPSKALLRLDKGRAGSPRTAHTPERSTSPSWSTTSLFH